MLTDQEIAKCLALYGFKLRKHPTYVNQDGSPYIVWRGTEYPPEPTSRWQRAEAAYGKGKNFESIEGLLRLMAAFDNGAPSDGWRYFTPLDLEYQPVEWEP